MSASHLLSAAGPLAPLLTAAEVRPAQLAMADAVQEAMEAGGRLVVEAPTGTGKSLAYLCAAAVARSGDAMRGLKVVVATGTKALQDQLANEDSPRLVKALKAAKLPVPVVEVVKGRRNYLCRLRLNRWQTPLGLDPVVLAQAKAIHAWSGRTVVGDRAELRDLPEDTPLWSELDADADACLGSLCEHHEECFITLLRQRAWEATLIITNHHLLCADMRLRLTDAGPDARVLPPWDVLVIDEAHRLPGTAAEHFGMGLSHAQVAALCRDAVRLLERPGQDINLRGAVALLEREAATLFGSVAQALKTTADGVRVPFSMAAHPDCKASAANVLDALAGLEAAAQGHGAVERARVAEFEAVARRAQTLQGELHHLWEARDERFAFCAEKRGARGRLMAYPTDVAGILRHTLLERPEPVIFTSATLAVAGDFNGFCSDVGLEPDTSVKCVALPSTFSAEQAVLYVPRDLPDPDSPDFADAAASRALKLVRLTGGGAFMLCTTTRAVSSFAKALESALPTLPVFRQGQAPKAELLARFKRHGDAVLVATHSFWEGVDVRGRALRLVMVDKLPFAPPADPLVATRIARAQKAGLEPFNTVQLPDAVTALRQGLGRLLRSKEDRGILCVLDGRLMRRGYGRRVIASLGGHPLLTEWSDVVSAAERLGVDG